MSFIDCLLYAILFFAIGIGFLGYIRIVLDIYYTRKEKHILKMLDGLAKAIMKVNEENKK